MKTRITIVVGAVAVLAAIALVPWLAKAAESSATFEYATLRWDGRDNTHLIRASGSVEILGPKFAGVKKPDRVDDRSFYMNLAMNALAREGFELVAITPDDYVFKRPSSK